MVRRAAEEEQEFLHRNKRPTTGAYKLRNTRVITPVIDQFKRRPRRGTDGHVSTHWRMVPTQHRHRWTLRVQLLHHLAYFTAFGIDKSCACMVLVCSMRRQAQAWWGERAAEGLRAVHSRRTGRLCCFAGVGVDKRVHPERFAAMPAVFTPHYRQVDVLLQ